MITIFVLWDCSYGSESPQGVSSRAGMSLGYHNHRGKSPTLGQISGGIDMEFPPMSPGIPRISLPWMGGGGGGGGGGRTYKWLAHNM